MPAILSRIPTAGLLAGPALLVATGLFTLAAPQPADALPRSCRITTYYQTAELETQVGMRTSCPGGQRWGRTTRFFETETVDLTPPGPGPVGGGGGNLPCEFLASGCSNLPTNRF